MLHFGGESPAALRALEPFLAFTPLLAVVAVRARDAARGESRAGVLPRLHVPGTGAWTYLFALTIFPVIATAALVIRFLQDGHVPVVHPRPLSQLIAFSVMLFLLPGLAEEPGWRGLLQRELRRRHGVFASSVIVGLVWAGWHARDRLLHPERFEQAGLAWFVFLIVAASVVIGWIFDRASGSLLVAMTAHFGANTVFHFMPVFIGQRRSTALIYTALVALTALVLGAIGGVARPAEPAPPPNPENADSGDGSDKATEVSHLLDRQTPSDP